LPCAFAVFSVVVVVNQHPHTGSASGEAYEAPAIRLLGSVPELTQQLIDKKVGPTDGFTFMGVAITNASP
jgi:hypothetical protein